MSSAFSQSQNFVGSWFASVMAGSAKCDKIFGVVRLGHGPRNNVVNIQFLPLAGQRVLPFSAALTFATIAFANALRYGLPVSTALVMSGSPTFPARMLAPRSTSLAGRDIANVRTKSVWLAVKGLKFFAASFARQNFRPQPAPSGPVIAGHTAEASAFCLISKGLKRLSASLTRFFDAGARLPLSSPLSFVPSRAAISPGAIARTVFAAAWASEVLPALSACMMDRLHMRRIYKNHRDNKYFDVACRRVEEAARQPDLFITPPEKPEQEALL